MSKKVNSNIVGLQSPWVTIYNKVVALFGRDEELTIGNLEADEANSGYFFTIASANSVKLNSLERILKNEFVLGNITLRIKFIYENVQDGITANDLRNAFAGNNILKDIKTVDTPLANGISYVLFGREVLQFFNDDITDYFGNYNGLAEDIARELFNEVPNVNYCTDIVPAN